MCEEMTTKFKEFCEANEIEPFLAIVWACGELDWNILVEDIDDDDPVNGVIIGTKEWIDNLYEGGSVNLGNQ